MWNSKHFNLASPSSAVMWLRCVVCSVRFFFAGSPWWTSRPARQCRLIDLAAGTLRPDLEPEESEDEDNKTKLNMQKMQEEGKKRERDNLICIKTIIYLRIAASLAHSNMALRVKWKKLLMLDELKLRAFPSTPKRETSSMCTCTTTTH